MLVHHPYDAFSHVGRALHRAGRRRPRRARHQAHHLPHERRLADRPGAGARGRAGQAGGGAGRAEGALRRGEATSAGRARWSVPACTSCYGLVGLKTHCKLALVVRREEGDRAPLRPHRHRQLPPVDRAALHRPRPVHVPRGRHGRRLRPVQPAHRLRPPAELPRAVGGARRPARAALVDEIRRCMRRARPGAPVADRAEDATRWSTAASSRSSTARRRPASQIDLIVRGICCLQPGVPGLSEQHPRDLDPRPVPGALAHLLFRTAQAETTYIGSADLMPRNLDHRIEVITPVDDPYLVAEIDAGARPDAGRHGRLLDARRRRRLAPPPAGGRRRRRSPARRR